MTSGTVTVELTGDISYKNIRVFIDNFIHLDGSPRGKSYKINFSGINSIDPAGVTALINITYYLHDRHKCQLSLIGLSSEYKNSEGSRFLEDIGFYEHVMPERKFLKSANCPKNCLPTFNLKSQDYHSWHGTKVTPWLDEVFAAHDHEVTQWHELYTVLGEVFANIKDHAGEEAQIASVFMQHFINEKNIHIAISDFGVGIPTNVRKKRPEITDDCAAIQQAVIDGFTTQTTPRNRGAGLDTLIKNIVHSNKGKVLIVSSFGEAEFYVNEQDQPTVQTPTEKIESIYPGTLIYLTVPIKTPETDEEDFQW